jgi:hypothetical protein
MYVTDGLWQQTMYGDNQMDSKKVHGKVLYSATWGDKYPLVFLLAIARLIYSLCCLRVTEAFISTASSFYSACGYAVREKKGLKKYLLIAVGGSVALLFSILAVFWKCVTTLHKKKALGHYFKATDLDVLGSVFTQAKWYQWAYYCFWAIRGSDTRTDATVALANKWYASQPCHSSNDVERMKERVVCLINLHPEWDATILSRLYPFIGEREKGIRERREVMNRARSGAL